MLFWIGLGLYQRRLVEVLAFLLVLTINILVWTGRFGVAS